MVKQEIYYCVYWFSSDPNMLNQQQQTINASNTKGVFVFKNKPADNLENTVYARKLIHGFNTGVTSCNLVLGEAVIDDNSSKIKVPVKCILDYGNLGYRITAPLVYMKTYTDSKDETDVDNIDRLLSLDNCDVYPDLDKVSDTLIEVEDDMQNILNQNPHLSSLINNVRQAINTVDNKEVVSLLSQSMMGAGNTSSGINICLAFKANREVREYMAEIILEYNLKNRIKEQA